MAKPGSGRARRAAGLLHRTTLAARKIGRTRNREGVARGRWRPPANPGGS